MSVSLLFFCLFCGLLIYPFVIYPALLALLPTAAPGCRPSRLRRLGPSRFALLFAVHDEADSLPETLRRLRVLKRLWPELQIWVWDDASRDASPRLLADAGSILTVRRGSRQIGKTTALRHLIEEVEADVLLMMDANIRLRPHRMLRFRGHFADPTLGAVSARSLPSGGAGSLLGRVYWGLEELVKSQETRTGNTIGCDGALWGIRRELYGAVAPGAADDFQPSMEALLAGWRVISDPAIVVEEAAVPDAQAPQRAWRIGNGAWAAHRVLWPRMWRRGGLDLFKYVSHKLIRWFAGIWLVLTGLAGLAVAAEQGLFFETLGLVAAIGLAGLLRISPFAGVTRIAAVFLGTSLGVLHSIRGGRVERWVPIRSRA